MITLDSCKIRIPISEVELIEPVLLGQIREAEINEQTGELTEMEFKQKAYKYERQGIKTRFLIEKQGSETFLTILLNAKLLEGRYLEGITAQNISPLIQQINQVGVVAIQESSMLGGLVTDTDFKCDFVATPEAMELIFLHFKKEFTPSSKRAVGVNHRNSKSSHMIQFNERATPYYLSRPFFKIYSKDLELKHGSIEFREAFINWALTEGLYRSEFTIKNKKHFEQFGIEDRTLQNILSLTQDTLKSIQKQYLIRNLRQLSMNEDKAPDSELRLRAKVYLGLIQSIEDLEGYSLLDLERGALNHLDKHQRQREKVYIDEAYNFYLASPSSKSKEQKADEIARTKEAQDILKNQFDI